MTEKRFAGKSVIVTGAGNGLGRAYAEAFAAEGASVTVADIDLSAAREAARAIEGSAPVGVDVADEESVASMVATAVGRFGGVDVLINNAGLHMGQYNLTSTLPLADWRRLFDVNVFGAALCARHSRDAMVSRGGGVILNQSSNSSYLGGGAYSVSKLALNGLTLSLAREFAQDGIRVLGIAPGMIASEAVLERLEDTSKQRILGEQLIRRFGRAEDLVGMALLLCSDDASFVTGQTVTVDGGFIKRV
ncbi:SDR family oxidoreductase [Parafrankia sp. EUN1f]|uniref:SDR family oxidoreductase n=1 Tax=Parafrankia sp. EUN1f TaxID=102897 RepID=UPI0001C45FCF|nr:SDR family oxidoreductase [Parafrankia sp. EUN1f]EFC81341.1 short-chain dehydrogenase/reductase SDR [Parafrankia sp. EUN1f]